MSFSKETVKIMKPGLAKDGSKIMVVRFGESWESRRYLTQEEMKLKKSDFPDDTIFITEGATRRVKKIWMQMLASKNALIDNIKHASKSFIGRGRLT